MANTLKIKRGTAATIPQGQLAEPLFTTDTYDLYIGKGSGGNQRIQNYIASGTSSQFLKGDGSLDSNTYQTALTFSSPLVNTSGTVTINQSSGTVDGYLSSTDWTTFNSKEPAITAGTTLQYYRGDKTFQTLDTSVVPENGPIYFTEPRVRATVLTGLNLSGGGTIAATDSILTAFGKVQNQISAFVGGATYQGTWNASTNTPTLASGTGTKGYYYIVSVNGTTDLDGITDWKVGDWAIFNGTTWDKVDNTDAVSSVNGFTGAVNLALDNISDVSAASPTNAQLLRFNGTSSLWENWTPTFEPALTKGNLTEATSSVLTITGGTGAVIGSGTTIEVASAGASQAGVVTTSAQTFAGVKTFSSTPVVPALHLTSMTAGTGALYYNTTEKRLTLANYNTDGILMFEVNGGVYAMAINADKSIRMHGYTTNGILKFGNSDGTIGVAVAGDFPTLNQNTTGSAATLTTARTLTIGATGKTFDGSANVSWSLAEIGAEPTLTKGNLTETTSSVLTITGGTGAVIGSGTTIEVKNAGLTQNGVVTTGTQTLAGAKTLTALLTGTRVSMTDSITSGVANSFAVTQTQRNGTDTGDIAMSVSHTITASSASNQLVIRAMSFGTNNNLTGGGAVTNYRGWNVASSTQTGTTTTHLDQIYIERGTADGTVTNNRAIRINNMQGTNRAAFFVLDIGDGGTNNSYMVLGSDASATIPNGNWGIYQIQSTYNNYFNGKVLIKTTTDAGYALDVNGTARLSGALTGTSATFSSSVTATGNITMNKTGGYGFLAQDDGNNTPANGAFFGFVNAAANRYFIHQLDTSNNIRYHYFNGTTWSPNIIQFTNTGAATFSSSVTANGLTEIIAGSGGTDWLRLTRTGVVTWAFNANNGDLNIANNTASTVPVVIKQGGNVGIGTTNPTAKLTAVVAASASDVHILELTNAVNASFAVYLKNDVTTLNAGGTGNMVFSNSAERMRITSGGNVGIGDTSPSSTINPTSAPVLSLKSTTAAYPSYVLKYINGAEGGITLAGSLYIDCDGNTTASNNAIIFRTGNTNSSITAIERMRITSSGNVGIGTNSPFSTARLQVKTGTDKNVAIQTGTAETTGIKINAFNDAGNTNIPMEFNGSVLLLNTNEAERMRITSGGELLINTTTDSGAYYLQVNGSVYATAYYESSDIRLKDVLTNSYSENFSAIEFMWKDKRDDKKHWGYAAQDVMKYIPDAIEVNNDGMMTVNYNEAHTWKIAQLEAKIVELEAKLK